MVDTSKLIDGLRMILEERLGDVETPEPCCSQCGAVVSVDSIWVERYAEMLGCDARPAAVAVAIDELMQQVQKVRESIKRHRAEAFKLGQRSVGEDDV